MMLQKERPILFSAPMVKAILAGNKTQTRRIVAPSNSFFGSAPKEYWNHADFSRAWPDGGNGGAQYLHVPCHVNDEGICAVCDHMGWPRSSHRIWSRVTPATDGRVVYGDSKGRPASRLWVKETFAILTGNGHRTVYAADGHPMTEGGKTLVSPMRWTPSIFMSRHLSRITVDVTAVRVQRLQEISEEDAVAEGCKSWKGVPGDGEMSAVQAYVKLWESIHGPHSWVESLWVWANSFERVRP